MTLKLQEVAKFGVLILFMFVYDKNKDTPLWIGCICAILYPRTQCAVGTWYEN